MVRIFNFSVVPLLHMGCPNSGQHGQLWDKTVALYKCHQSWKCIKLEVISTEKPIGHTFRVIILKYKPPDD